MKKSKLLKNNNFVQYLWLLVKQWYVCISILLTVYNLVIVYWRPSWQITPQVTIIVLILTVIYAGYKIWIEEKSEKEKLLAERELTSEEKDILKEAIGTGKIYKLPSTDQTGASVRAGNRDFCFDNDPERTQVYSEALDRLIEKKLVFHEIGILYKLTSKGYRIAKK